MIGTYNETVRTGDICVSRSGGKRGEGNLFIIVQNCKYVIGCHNYYSLLLHLYEEIFLAEAEFLIHSIVKSK